MNALAPLPRSLGAFVWYFLKPYKQFIVCFTFLAMLTGVWAPLNSILIKSIIDRLAATSLVTDASVVFWPALFFVCNFEAHNLCWRGMGYLNYRFEARIKNQIIAETFGYVHRHTHQFFQDHLAGRIASQINTLADNIERMVHDIWRHLVRIVVLLMVALVTLYHVHPQFCYALFIFLFVFSALGLCMSRKMVGFAKAHASAESALAGQLVDSIGNAAQVRIFARRLYEMLYLKQALNVTQQTFQTKEKFAIRLHFVQGLLLSAFLGSMLYFLIVLRTQNQVSIGDFALILGLSVEVGFMIWWSLEQVDELNKCIGKCNQSLSGLFLPLDIVDQPNAPDLKVTQGRIEFLNVQFSYKGNEALFQKKSVVIEPGQKVGLVGYSGSGKSTFVHLILRLYDVSEGQILIDHQDIRGVTQDSLRQNIGMIPQDPSLFHRTLMDNIRYGCLEATDEAVKDAAQRAHAHAFIARLPEGYGALVGERGIKLSGGQRQRIAIARAILKNAPILILDEATSQLDSLTENDIQESLWRLMQNKTTVVIAHRLSTLLQMDRILVFEQGKIVEDGTHAQLLAQKGRYKALWDAQVGGFLPQQA
jgi:ATP-binding cassette subfamily B protein